MIWNKLIIDGDVWLGALIIYEYLKTFNIIPTFKDYSIKVQIFLNDIKFNT